MIAKNYKKGMKIVEYTESKEIEIISEDMSKWYFYFQNVSELAELIKTSPKLAKKLKELL